MTLTAPQKVYAERFVDMLLPLLLIGVVMQLNGKGFPTFWPVLAGTVFSVLQPFARGFIFDETRDKFERLGKFNQFLVIEAAFYLALAALVCKWFV